MPQTIPQSIPTLPERQGEFKRLLNAINGAELRNLIISSMTETLANDRRFANHLTFPLAAVSIRLDVMVQPRENPHFFLEKSMAYAEMAKGEDGEPLDGEVIEVDATWPSAVLINVRSFLGLDRAPDEIRQDSGMEVPTARRQQRSPAAFEQEADRSPRSVVIGGEEEDLSDLPEAFQNKYHALKQSDPATAKRLLSAVRQLGYKHHPDSPISTESKIITPEQDAQERASVIPSTPPNRGAKRASVKPSQQIPNPAADLEKVMAQQDEARHRTLPPRKATIKSGSRTEARAVQQMGAAPDANREVKFHLEDAAQGAPGLGNLVAAGELVEGGE